MKEDYQHIPFKSRILEPDEMLARAKTFHQQMQKRRSIRFFSNREVSEALISEIIATAGTAPSGANKQPWTFCAVSSPEIKGKIRQSSEEEERKNYSERMSERWLRDLSPLGTDANKAFLEDAPWLIVVFKRVYEYRPDGTQVNNYYVNESVGIACGLLIAAIHNAGLCCLTHTPSPMQFLARILKRPDNERPFLLLPVGYPSSDCTVPDIQRKQLKNISAFY